MEILTSEILESHYVWTKNAEHLFMAVFILIIVMVVLSIFASFSRDSFSINFISIILEFSPIIICFVGLCVIALYGSPEKFSATTFTESRADKYTYIVDTKSATEGEKLTFLCSYEYTDLGNGKYKIITDKKLENQ